MHRGRKAPWWCGLTTSSYPQSIFKKKCKPRGYCHNVFATLVVEHMHRKVGASADALATSFNMP
eukprot:3079186-Amphidinium_carterae.1